jgi:hypothetical protein
MDDSIETEVDFIGWKLEDIADIMSQATGFEMPIDAPGDWSEPLNGNLLAAFLESNHFVKIAWSFAVPNPRSSQWTEIGTILVGLPINRNSVDMDAMTKIADFHQFLKMQRAEAPEPMYVIEKEMEHPTVPGIWWDN